MVSKFGAWWQTIKQHWVAIVVVAIGLVVVLVLIVVGYSFDWTGFTRKTLWDWLQLLIIPVVLAVAALLFNLANSRTERQIALEKQREDILQAYLDRISELLLEKQLGASASEEVRNVARVRTITVLAQLDAKRVSHVFAFLREAGLMSAASNNNVVSLSEANFQRVDWSEANLFQANLSGARFQEANLRGAFLRKANLSNSILWRVDLIWASLREANLSGAYLVQANLNHADLRGADLSGANLKDAIGVTVEGLEEYAKLLTGATMPDGSIHP